MTGADSAFMTHISQRSSAQGRKGLFEPFFHRTSLTTGPPSSGQGKSPYIYRTKITADIQSQADDSASDDEELAFINGRRIFDDSYDKINTERLNYQLGEDPNSIYLLKDFLIIRQIFFLGFVELSVFLIYVS